MKKLICSTMVLGLGIVCSQATPIISESFDVDGALTSYTDWSAFTGNTANPVQAFDGVATLIQRVGIAGQDVALDFTDQGSTDITYAGFYLTILGGATVSATDSRLFGFNDDDGSDATGRTFLKATADDYTLGIATDGGAPAQTWATDLSFDTQYRVVLGYDAGTGQSSLWVDPTSEGDTSIFGGGTTSQIVGNFEMAQRGDHTADMVIDDLVISATFDEASLVPEPGTFALLLLGSVAVFARRRQFKNAVNS